MRLLFGSIYVVLVLFCSCYAGPCDNNNGGCHGNAVCTDLNGRVSCQCTQPYIGNGTSCILSCTGGYYTDKSGSCKKKSYAFSSDLRFIAVFSSALNNENTVEYKAHKLLIETTLTAALQPKLSDLDVFLVKKFRPGIGDQVYTDCDYVMKSASTTANQVSVAIHSAITNNELRSLDIDKQYLPVVKAFDKCEYSNSNDCHTNADCINNNGAYTCKCKSGYTGDGITCTGPTMDILTQNIIITDLKLNLYEIAAKYTNTNFKIIKDHYKLQTDIEKFLNETNFQKIATCLDLTGTYSLDFIFNRIKYANANPNQAITEFLTRVSKVANAQQFHQVVLTNYATSFIGYCSAYPRLLSTAGYHAFLSPWIAKEFSLTNTELGIFAERFQMTPFLALHAVANWTGIGQEGASAATAAYVNGYYDGINVAKIMKRLTKSRDIVMNMTLIDISVKYANVSEQFLKSIYKLALISDQVIKVLSDLTLSRLEIGLDISLLDKHLSILFELISANGKSLVNEPLVKVLGKVNLYGLNVILDQTVMELLVKAGKMKEELLISWFGMSSDTVSSLKEYKLSKYFLIHFPVMEPRQLQNIYLFTLMDQSFLKGITSKAEVNTLLKTEHIRGVKFVLQTDTLNHLKTLYTVTDASLTLLPLAEVISDATGLDLKDVAGFFPRASFTLMRTLTLPQLVLLGSVSTSMTLMQFSDALISATKDLREQELLATPVSTLTIFRDQTETQLKLKFKDYFAEEIGVSFDKLKLDDGKTALMQVANNNIIQMNKSLVTTNGNVPSTLTVRQLATLTAYPDAVFLLKDMSLFIQQITSMISTNDRITVGSVMSILSGHSIDKIKILLTAYLGNANAAQKVLDKLLKDVYDTLKNDLSSMTLSDMLVVIAETDTDLNVFLPFKLLKHKCSAFNGSIDSGFESMRTSCFVNNKYLKLMNYNIIEPLTITNIEELKGKMTYDTMSLNYISAVTFTNKVFKALRDAANRPLIIEADKAGISLDDIKSNTILKTALLICRKYHPVTEFIFAKLFRISSGQMSSARFTTLSVFQTVLRIDNIKLFYTTSLYTIFEIQAAAKTVNYVIQNDLPKFISMMSRIHFVDLPKIYNIAMDASYTNENIINVMLQLFGINALTVQNTFGIEIADTNLLQRRTLGDILHLGTIPSIKLGELSQNSPVTLMSFILGFSTYKMQDLLLSQPVSIATSLGTDLNKLGLVKVFIGKNTFGVSSSNLGKFIQYYYSGTNPTVTGTEILAGFFDADLSVLSQKFGVTMGNQRWMEIIIYAQKNVQFTKLLQLKLSKWPVTLTRCLTSSVNCNFKDIFDLYSRSLTRDVSSIGLDSRFVLYLSITDLQQYRNLLGISQQKMLDQTFTQVLLDTSNEYIRLKTKLMDNPIIELLIASNISGEVAMPMSFNSLLTTLAGTTLGRLQYAKQYVAGLDTATVQKLKSSSMTKVNEYIYGSTSTNSNVLFLSLHNVISFYTGQLNLQNAKSTHMTLAKKFRDTKTTASLFSICGKSIALNHDQSVIFIATDFLGITRTQMKSDGVSDGNLDTLSNMTINDFIWIFPKINYYQSTISEVQQAIKKSVVAGIFIRTFNKLKANTNINLGKKGFIENIELVTGYSADKIYHDITERIQASLKGKSLAHDAVYRRIISQQPLEAYAAKTKQNEASLYGMKSKDLAIKMYNDISLCYNKTYCEQRDAQSTCSSSTYGSQCGCKPGYQVNGILCKNIDECAARTNPCQAFSTCTDTIGSYTCTCNSGYYKNGTKCLDTNECNTSPCDQWSTCENTPGSFKCGPCPSGFSGNGFKCDDINECNTNRGGCNVSASCKNTIGSFLCMCNTGFIGDGVICNDVNECNLNHGGCHVHSSCRNTFGSHKCTCNKGYVGNGVNCTDVNECSNVSACHKHAICKNTQGGHSCTCKPGFATHGAICEDINECAANNKLCHTQCINVPGSYNCAPCPESQAGNGTTCFDSCAKANCPKHSICRNVGTGHLCLCSKGRYKTKDKDGKCHCNLARKIVEFKGLTLKYQFKKIYLNLTAKVTIEFMKKVQDVLVKFLLTKYKSVGGVQITKLKSGSVVATFVVSFKDGNETLPNANQVKQDISSGIENNKLNSIGAVTSPLSSAEKNICEIGGDNCGKHGSCVIQGTGHRCNCNDDYVEVDGTCVQDDDLALKIALPIVIFILLLLFIGGACYSYQNNKKRKSNNYEMGGSPVRASYTSHGDTYGNGKAEDVSHFDNLGYVSKGEHGNT